MRRSKFPDYGDGALNPITQAFRAGLQSNFGEKFGYLLKIEFNNFTVPTRRVTQNQVFVNFFPADTAQPFFNCRKHVGFAWLALGHPLADHVFLLKFAVGTKRLGERNRRATHFMGHVDNHHGKL